MQFCHLFQNLSRAAGIAESPACHSVSLGKSVNQDRPLPHTLHFHNGYMLFLISKLRINLIRHDKYVMFSDDLRDLLQILPLHNGPRRIIREGQNQYLCLFRYGIFQFLRRQAELIFFLQFNSDRHSARHNGTGLIGHKTWLRDQHLISGIHHSAQTDINRLGTSHRDQHLMLRIVSHTLLSLYVIADLLPQLHQSAVRSVECAPFFQGINTLVPDMPRCVKIRLSHAEGDGVVHLADDIKKFPNTRRLQANGLL